MSLKPVLNVLFVLLYLLAAYPVFSCKAGSQAANGDLPGVEGKRFRIGFVTGTAGLGDKSFNDTHFKGLISAKKEYGIDFEYRTPADDSSFEGTAESLIADGSNVIFAGAGFYMIDVVDRLSAKYPDVFFLMDDVPAKTYRPNVATATYRQNEGSFLAGALAGLVSKTGVVAFFGASDFVTIKDFYVGFEEGARYVSPGISVVERYIDKYLAETGAPPDVNCFSAPNETKRMALGTISGKNADVIFFVSGSSGIGGFMAAKQTGTWAIGVDSDQDFLMQGSVLASMMKNVDRGILFLVGELVKGTIRNRNYVLGFNENGVGLSPMTYTKEKVSAATLAKIGLITEKIKSGEIKVGTAF